MDQQTLWGSARLFHGFIRLIAKKGAIENTNKLIRQYIPKGANINNITDALITKIHMKNNKRPREKLNFSTPVKEFFKHFP